MIGQTAKGPCSKFPTTSIHCIRSNSTMLIKEPDIVHTALVFSMAPTFYSLEYVGKHRFCQWCLRMKPLSGQPQCSYNSFSGTLFFRVRLWEWSLREGACLKVCLRCWIGFNQVLQSQIHPSMHLRPLEEKRVFPNKLPPSWMHPCPNEELRIKWNEKGRAQPVINEVID